MAIVNMQLRTLELRAAKKLCDFGYAGMHMQTNISLKSCGYAVAEVLPSNGEVAVADIKEIYTCRPLTVLA